MTENTGLIDVPVAEIRIGDRARRNAFNVLGLADSIKRLGLLHPIVLNGRYELVAGGRRLAAVRMLGWQSVVCRVIDTLDDAVAALVAERDENTCRESLGFEDLVELGRRLEELEKPKAKGRQAEAGPASGKGKKATGSGKLPEPVKGDTRDKVAAALGVSGKTYEKAKAVVEAAEAEPDRYGDLPAVMDATGKVDPVYRQMRERAESLSAEAQTTDTGAGVPETSPPAATDGPTAWADKAINCLMQIPPDDPYRARAAQMVAEWIEANLKRGAASAGPVGHQDLLRRAKKFAENLKRRQPSRKGHAIERDELLPILADLIRAVGGANSRMAATVVGETPVTERADQLFPDRPGER